MISTLPSLSGENPADIEGILANLTLGLLPSPVVSGSESELPPVLRARLIHDLRIRLRLKRDDNSPEAMSKIYDYLAKEIGRIALANVDIKEIKSRLGQRGDLASTLYQIEFTPQFVEGYERRGVNRTDVERTLQAPDRVDHIVPTGLGMHPDKATSLYVKLFHNKSTPSNTFSLLVACERVGYVQRVGHAWRIFHSDVDLSATKTAIDVLRAFLDKYGITITVGEKTDHFFWYERVPIKSNAKTDILKFDRPENVDMEVTFQRGLIIDGTLEIVYAFAINNTAYEADLLKHGIRTKPLPPKK
ncbi:MAG: hypothetical protein ACR2HX_08950 [Pyrinomonadaceae bacterium]